MFQLLFILLGVIENKFGKKRSLIKEYKGGMCVLWTFDRFEVLIWWIFGWEHVSVLQLHALNLFKLDILNLLYEDCK